MVVAEDTGEPVSRRGVAQLLVQVTDSNDNNPVFVEVSESLVLSLGVSIVLM